MTTATHPDLVAGPFTDELNGTILEYRYSTGHHYRLRLDLDGVRFTQLAVAGGAPEEGEIGPIPYLARQLRDRLFLVHWLVRPGIHVALVVDLERGLLHSSGMMPPGQWEFFDVAEILAVDGELARSSGPRRPAP